MKLPTILNHELDRRMSPVGQITEPLVVNAEGGRLECRLAAIEQLAVAFEQLSFHAPRLEQAKLDELQQIATRLSQRLSYLMEAIHPVETDREGCVVQMRSNPPHQDDHGTSYYELVVRRGQLSLCRFTKAGGEARRQLPAQMTREVFCRLAQDLVNAADVECR